MINWIAKITCLVLLISGATCFGAEPAPLVSKEDPNRALFEKWMQSKSAPKETTTAQTTTTTTQSIVTPLPPAVTLASPPPPSPSPAPPAPPAAPIFFETPSDQVTTSDEPPKRPAPFFEADRQAMLDSISGISPEASNDSKSAFNALLQQNMPLTPTQVVKLHQQIDLAQRAAAVPANIPPKPVSTTLMINQAPGATPPVVRLAQGYVSSLVFVDSTGSPWPIAAFDIGNPKAVNMQWDGKSNILLIQAVSPYSDGNLVVRLVGLATPLTLEIVSGQRVVDYRVDIHVSGIGPNTKELPLGTELPNSANELLLGVLDGVAPAGSKLLTVRGGDCQAWLLGEKIYFRTRMTVLSPGWVGTMVSPDGMHAYELPKTSSVLISRYGEPHELKIEGL